MATGGSRFQKARSFVREYTAGIRSRDLHRLFRQDASEAFQVLTRDQPAVPPEAKGIRAFFQRARILFLGLSYTLTPARRLLFALAMLLALTGSCVVRYQVHGREVQVGAGTMPLLLAIVLLVFLLALELVDRIRVRDELQVARELQGQILPREAPEVTGYRFAHSYRTANEVGGDYYGFRTLADGRLVLVAGDASGHGIAAGLLMVIAHATIDLAIGLDPRPEKVAPLINKAIASAGGRRSFFTLFYALLDPSTGHMDYLCAGHPFPLLRRAGGQVVELGRGALPLGVRSTIQPRPDAVTLEPGDLLLLYSDGLAEQVQPASGEAFGFDRVRDLVAAGGSAAELHRRLLAAFDAFLGDAPRGDDVSLVVVERRADPGRSDRADLVA
jgi:serine phosphatase RsbU (regulator of sigma subunit)